MTTPMISTSSVRVSNRMALCLRLLLSGRSSNVPASMACTRLSTTSSSVPKLHRPWPARGRIPAWANSFVVQRGVETTTRIPRHQAVTMWTHPADRAPSYGPCGQGMDKCAALAHPLPTLGALATTSSPLQQQSFMRKATSPPPDVSRIAPSSQEIRRPNNPVKSLGDLTR